MSKVLSLVVALALVGVVPSVASAQTTPSSGGSGTGNTVTGNTNTGGTINAGSGSQNCQQQGIAGRDVNQSCVNSQVGTSRTTGTSGVRTGTTGVRSTGVTGTSGVGNGVQSVSLARTGFDAWVLALLGGISVAGGLALLAAQRRGRLHG